MNRLKNRTGITLAEMLVVVLIIVILSGVVYLTVHTQQRSLGQVERDGIAKEIFVAAQNHLTAVFGEGYLGLKETDADQPFGTPETDDNNDGIADDGIYYIVVNGGDTASILNLMLPFGAVDETVLAGGSYIIRYHKDTGTVLDVFYCTKTGQYKHEFAGSAEYDHVLGLKPDGDDDHKSERRTYTYKEGENSILGWYGGVDAASLAKLELEPPMLNVVNGDRLYVEVTDTNYSIDKAMLQLIIEGVESHAKKKYVLSDSLIDSRVDQSINVYTVVLDDITTSGLHFAELRADTDEQFIPGENLRIRAVAYSSEALANIAYSTEKTTNSLYADGTTTDTARIGSIRHLENLDQTVSNLDANDTSENKVDISSAVQIDNLSWSTFNSTPVTIYGYDSVAGSYALTSESAYYYPIRPDYPLTYDGKNHSISDVAVNTGCLAFNSDANDANDVKDAGLFGSVSTVSAIKNLELIDFSVTGTTSAGALAGTLSGCTVTNVLVRNSESASANVVTAATAGGLIGKLASGTVQYSAAAVTVSGSTTAGGLIGDAAGTVTSCYSGGHTLNGSYDEWVKSHPYDVTGGTVGGLVGTSAAAISNSYSTCSVSGTVKAAGFAGKATGAITNCYATGLVHGTTSDTAIYAFLADGTPGSGNYYYRIINEIRDPTPGAEENATVPMPPYSDPNAVEVKDHISKVKPLDLNAASYNVFVGPFSGWNSARAFDPALVKYYSGKYTLRTVDELNGALPDGYNSWDQLYVKAQYGDWPSPEVFFINN